MKALSQAEKRQGYQHALKWVVGGLLTCITTSYFVSHRIVLDLGRGLPDTDFVFTLGILSIMWGAISAFITFLAFEANE